MTKHDQVRISRRTVYRYADELIVELTGVDPDDDLVALAYRFEYSERSKTATPKQSVDDSFTSEVQSALSESGYQWLQDDDS